MLVTMIMLCTQCFQYVVEKQEKAEIKQVHAMKVLVKKSFIPMAVRTAIEVFGYTRTFSLLQCHPFTTVTHICHVCAICTGPRETDERGNKAVIVTSSG